MNDEVLPSNDRLSSSVHPSTPSEHKIVKHKISLNINSAFNLYNWGHQVFWHLCTQYRESEGSCGVAPTEDPCKLELSGSSLTLFWILEVQPEPCFPVPVI